jgi:hypothetical protein
MLGERMRKLLRRCPMTYSKLSLSWRVIVVFLAVAVAAAAYAGKTSADRRELKFSHKLHTDNNLDCQACHDAAKSAAGTDDLLPKHANCADCHDVQAADNCKMCHLNAAPKLSARITSYSVKFSHDKHLGADLKCTTCHANLDAALSKDRAGHLPVMADCMTCHEQKQAKTDCKVCHLPTDDLKPNDHKLDWTNRHGLFATGSQESCKQCHKTDDCQKCHNGDIVFSPHPRNYVARHGQDAHLSDMNCSVCHDQTSFCNACHRQMNVLPKGHFTANWATPQGGEHADQAAFDLESCIACHDQPNKQPVCARCHQK